MSVLQQGETTGTARMPHGWRDWGQDASAYEMGFDEKATYCGKRSAYVKSRRPNSGFGTMMQVVRADHYRGKRLRLLGSARASGVEDWAGLWMRVDGPKKELLGFDNMQQRPITGTTGWARYQVVLDVPEESVHVAFGFLLAGSGQIWAADLHLDTVSVSTPTTTAESDEVPTEPVNLDFSQ